MHKFTIETPKFSGDTPTPPPYSWIVYLQSAGTVPIPYGISSVYSGGVEFNFFFCGKSTGNAASLLKWNCHTCISLSIYKPSLQWGMYGIVIYPWAFMNLVCKGGMNGIVI